MGGMVLETNMNEIVAQIEAQNRLEKSEVRNSCTLSCLGRGQTLCLCSVCIAWAGWVGCVCWVGFCFPKSVGGGRQSVFLGLSALT